LTACLGSCYTSVADAAPSNPRRRGTISITGDIRDVFLGYPAAWSAHDVEKVASFFTDDCVFEDMAVGVVNRYKEEAKDFAADGL